MTPTNYGYDDVSTTAATTTTTTTATQSAAVESAVDAYATKLLRQRSPPEACIDDNLGPYVTSMLRCCSPRIPENVTELPDYDSLMELLEEHCSLETKDDARDALTTIANAVRTGVIHDEDHPNHHMTTPDHLAALMLLDEDMTNNNNNNNDAYGIQFQFSTEEDDEEEETTTTTTNSSQHPETPLADDFKRQYAQDFASPAFENNPFASRTNNNPADKLIPVDLMGVLNNPKTPIVKNTSNKANILAQQQEEDEPPEAFPPLGSSTPAAAKKTVSGRPTSRPRQYSIDEGKDLAAALFRPRQHSIDEQQEQQDDHHQMSINSITTTAAAGEESSPYQVDSIIIDMLLSMTVDLSDEAALAAAQLAVGDINVAQYVVDGAMSAPPICRHMLNDGCYRSDCQFSHDVDAHTCLFWLRGRCGKSSCRFHHGFSKKLLAGMNRQVLEQSSSLSPSSQRSTPVGIPTKNLLSHNMEATAPMMNSWSSGGGFGGGAYSLQSQRSSRLRHQQHGWDDYHNDGGAGTSLPSCFKRTSSSRAETTTTTPTTPTTPTITPLMSPEQQEANTFSFASVASKGYKNDSFATKIAAAASNAAATKPKFVKIPQDLWNHHVNRDAGAFHIQDPLQRYAEVCKSVPRPDVIDLHFQSTKTFAMVLSTVLPLKLRENNQVWIVTGSGHHVARNSHQAKGGALEASVQTWLEMEGYAFVKGRDRNGHSGAVLVKSTTNA
mmetsp:Transcript_14976/g.24774  ORF Transcript_14976/g.24774 Transcript_14976/m.24774 type:complete len:723 (-) Transcript_14976:61-2229(-)